MKLLKETRIIIEVEILKEKTYKNLESFFLDFEKVSKRETSKGYSFAFQPKKLRSREFNKITDKLLEITNDEFTLTRIINEFKSDSDYFILNIIKLWPDE